MKILLLILVSLSCLAVDTRVVADQESIASQSNTENEAVQGGLALQFDAFAEPSYSGYRDIFIRGRPAPFKSKWIREHVPITLHFTQYLEENSGAYRLGDLVDFTMLFFGFGYQRSLHRRFYLGGDANFGLGSVTYINKDFYGLARLSDVATGDLGYGGLLDAYFGLRIYNFKYGEEDAFVFLEIAGGVCSIRGDFLNPASIYFIGVKMGLESQLWH